MKYKVGDKVRIKSLDWYNENKGKDGYVDAGLIFDKNMSRWCGKTMTILKVYQTCYAMEEDYISQFFLTDEMIEGLVEEDCPQDFIEKYCKSCGTQRCDRTKEFLDGCPHYNEYMSIKQNNAVEEDTKPEPKFKVGEIVYSKTWQRDVIILDILPDGVYKVGDKHGLGWFKANEDNLLKEKITLPTDSQPFK